MNIKNGNLIVSCLFSVVVFGQELKVEIGQTISTFNYKNSNLNKMDLQSSENMYLGLGYLINLKGQSRSRYWSLMSSLNYNHYGSNGYLKVTNTDYFLQWDLHFLAANIGVIHSWKKDLFTLTTELGGSYEFLLVGNQYTNEVPSNLKRNEEFNNQFIFYRMGLGVSYEMTQYVKLFIQYNYGRSLPLLDKSLNSKERLILDAHKVGIGMQITMTNRRGLY